MRLAVTLRPDQLGSLPDSPGGLTGRTERERRRESGKKGRNRNGVRECENEE